MARKPLVFGFALLFAVGCSTEITSSRGDGAAKGARGKLADPDDDIQVAEVPALIVCTAAVTQTADSRILSFQDNLGRFCKRWVDRKSHAKTADYDIREIYDRFDRLRSVLRYETSIKHGRLVYVLEYSEKRDFLGRVDYSYGTDGSEIRLHQARGATDRDLIPIRKQIFKDGVVQRAEVYKDGALFRVTIYNGERSDTYDALGNRTSTVTTQKFPKTALPQHLEPSIQDYLEDVVLVTDTVGYSSVTGLVASRVRHIRTLRQGLRKEIVFDLEERERPTRAKYFDPFTGHSFSIVTYPGTMCNGYSATYSYSADQLLQIRRQQIKARELFSDLGRRTDYVGRWCDVELRTEPTPAGLSAFRADLMEIHHSEIDLIGKLPPEAKRKLTIFVGDSNTFHRPPGYPIVPAGHVILNLGVPNATSRSLIEPMGAAHELRHPALRATTTVILSVGTSDLTDDIVSGFPASGSPSNPRIVRFADDLAVNLLVILREIHAALPQAQIRVLGLTPVIDNERLQPSHIHAINSILSNRLRGPIPKVTFHDPGAALIGADGKAIPRFFRNDGAQLSLLGHAIIARQLFPLMN